MFVLNILFLTIFNVVDLEQRDIYPDLLREFVRHSHKVTVVAPAERRFKEETNFKKYDGYNVLRVKIGNMQKTNIIEKGITTITLENKFLSAIKKYCSDTKFDLIMYSTPPITFSKVIDYVKKRDGAKTYLLLKDIFPQNAVDLGMFSERSLFYKYFRQKEKKLYRTSDHIGCMSQANVDYVIKHNPYVNPEIVHVSPNSVDMQSDTIDKENRQMIRNKYNIPEEAKAFVYGGNLGKPQGIPFLIKCLDANTNRSDCFFVISGTGTEYPKLKAYIDEEKPTNVLLINGLPKDEYEELVLACDVGLIFLDHRFTIPNFPSRILAYMQKKMPVIACTDPNTDMGRIITENNFGWWCESNDANKFTKLVDTALTSDLKSMGENGFEFLKDNYTVEQTYKIIADKIFKN